MGVGNTLKHFSLISTWISKSEIFFKLIIFKNLLLPSLVYISLTLYLLDVRVP